MCVRHILLCAAIIFLVYVSPLAYGLNEGKLSETNNIPPVRGNLSFYILNTDEKDFYVTIYKQDFNWREGPDTLNIELISPDGNKSNYTIDDDGINKIGSQGIPQWLSLIIHGTRGIYVLNLKNNGDMALSINTSLEKIILSGDLSARTNSEVFFYVSDIASFSVSVISYWDESIPNSIEFYDSKDNLLGVLNITEKNKLTESTIEVPNESRNSLWILRPNKSPYLLSFKDIPNIFSYNKGGFFDIENYSKLKVQANKNINYYITKRFSLITVFLIVIAIISLLKDIYNSKIGKRK